MTLPTSLTIVAIDRISLRLIIVHFSDHTYATFSVDQLLSLCVERDTVTDVGYNDV